MTVQILELKDYVPFAALLLSAVSLLVVAYKEFWQGPRLAATIDQLILLRLPTGNRQRLAGELLLRDLISNNPSPGATTLLASVAGLRPAVEARNLPAINAALDAYLPQHPMNYDPPKAVLESAVHERFFPRSFALPLIVSNSGRKVGHISTLVLVFRSKTEPHRRWLFVPNALLDPKRLTTPPEPLKDTDRLSGLFVGLSVHPSSSAQALIWFLPQEDLDGTLIEQAPLPVGHHEACLIGYGALGQELFRSRWTPYELKLDDVVNTAKGTDSSAYTTGSAPARKALEVK